MDLVIGSLLGPVELRRVWVAAHGSSAYRFDKTCPEPDCKKCNKFRFLAITWRIIYKKWNFCHVRSVDTLNEKLGSIIKQRLKARGLRAKDLAKVLCITTASVSRWLSGKTQIGVLDGTRISEFLGCSFSELVQEAESQFPAPRFSDRVSDYLTRDPRRHLILVTLNIPCTAFELSERYGLSHQVVGDTLKFLLGEKLVIQLPMKRWQLSELGRRSWLGHTESAFQLKSKFYGAQGVGSLKAHLSKDEEYWKTRFDRMGLSTLTDAQTVYLKSRLAEIIAEADKLEQTNLRYQSPEKLRITAFFLAMKPYDECVG